MPKSIKKEVVKAVVPQQLAMQEQEAVEFEEGVFDDLDSLNDD